MGATSQQLAGKLAALAQQFISNGFSGPDAAAGARQALHRQFEAQVNLLSFMDCFRVSAWITLATVPLLLLVKRFKPAGTPAAAH